MIDTNVRISALLCEGTARDCLPSVVNSDPTILTTLSLKDELNEVIRRKALTETAHQLTLHTQLQVREQFVTPDPNFEQSAAIRTIASWPVLSPGTPISSSAETTIC